MRVEDQTIDGNGAKPYTPTLSSAARRVNGPATPNPISPAISSPSTSPRKVGSVDVLSSTNRPRTGLPKPRLNGNITPRSVARTSRGGTASPSTPAGASCGTSKEPRPALISSDNYQSGSQRQGPLGLRISNAEPSISLEDESQCLDSTVSTAVSLDRRTSFGDDTPTSEPLSSCFFRADDAKSSVSSQEADERPIRSKATTFYHANGEIEGSLSPDASPSVNHTGRRDVGANMSSANSKTAACTPKFRIAPGAKVLTTSAKPSRHHVASVQKGAAPLPRPLSPSKMTGLANPSPTLTSNEGARVLKRVSHSREQRESFSSDLPLIPHQLNSEKTSYLLAQRAEKVSIQDAATDVSRRGSLGGTSPDLRQVVHRKSASLHSTEPKQSPSGIAKSPFVGPNFGSPPISPRRKINLSIDPKAVAERRLSGSPLTPGTPKILSPLCTGGESGRTIMPSVKTQSIQSIVEPKSPIKAETPQAQIGHLQNTNELAASARRERKVLDLEISNSSLLVINRTLEREMRKQSVELRRFRRLSRSGRLSMAASSTRSTSGQSSLSILTETEDETSGLSDLEELSDISEGEETDEDLDSSFDDDSALLSPIARAEHDAKHRIRDDKRLMLDLRKHQEMFADSQKMSMSIRRCLNWTEELIKEGQKALDYSVKASDVELGGRVLSHEDDGAPPSEARKGLLSPTTMVNALEEAQLWADGLHDLDGSVRSLRHVPPAMSPVSTQDIPTVSPSVE